MNDLPLVSIIIPAYNCEKYILATIKSAIDQTYPNIEIIAIDDGSSDRTAELIKSIKDPRFAYYWQENKGLATTRNNGIAKAKGKYIALLDSDDLFLPDKIAVQSAYMESHPECGVCYSKIYHFFGENSQSLYYNPGPHPSGQILTRLFSHSIVNPLSSFIRKSVLDQYGAFQDGLRRCEDHQLWLKLAYNKVAFHYLDVPLALYRVHQQSLTHDKNYLKENRAACLGVLRTVRSWMTAEEARALPFRRAMLKTITKLAIGQLISGDNMLARLLHRLYIYRMNLKLKPV